MQKQKRSAGEKLARASIYGIFLLAVFGAGLFAWQARLFSMSGYGAPVQQSNRPALEAAAGTGATPARAGAPALPGGNALMPTPGDGRGVTAGEEALAPPATVDAAPIAEDVPALAPAGPVPDLATINAEWERLAAMGLELPQSTVLEFMGAYHATAYCCEVYPHICGGNGVTASGTVPTPGLTCATDWKVLPPGSWIYIEGVGIRRVEDSGSAIKGARLDIAIDTHENALRWPGFGSHNVWVLYWAE